MSLAADTLEADGVAIVERVGSEPLVAVLRRHIEEVALNAPGVRGTSIPKTVADFISAEGPLGALACAFGRAAMRPVRVLLFDKTPASNWAVPWHQDRTIAVEKRIDVPGFGPWTVKNGVVHVEPPVNILEGMLTLRLFVDDCDAANGPLEVARRSHRAGRVPAADVNKLAERCDILVATGRSTDVLAMKLLAIHRSKAAAAPEHRRVLHVDYASTVLPPPLAWGMPRLS